MAAIVLYHQKVKFVYSANLLLGKRVLLLALFFLCFIGLSRATSAFVGTVPTDNVAETQNSAPPKNSQEQNWAAFFESSRPLGQDWRQYAARDEVKPELQTPGRIVLESVKTPLTEGRTTILLLTLQANNIQVRAVWKVTSALNAFDIDNGKLSLTADPNETATFVATVYLIDNFQALNTAYQNLTASAVITVSVEAAAAMTVALAVAQPPRLEVTAGVAGEVYVFEASGGIMPHTYTLLHNPDDNAFHFTNDTLSVNISATIGEYRFTVAVNDAASVTVTVAATVEVLERLRLLSVPSLTVTTSEERGVVYSFAVDGGVGDKTYSLENVGAGFGFEFDGATLVLRDDAEAGLYTLSVLAQDGTQESRVSVTVLVIEDVVLSVGVLMSPVWSTFNGAVATLTASGGNGDGLEFALVGDSQVFTIAEAVLLLNAGLRGHQGAATLSATVSVSDGNDSAVEVITVLVSSALQVSLADGLIAPVHAQYAGLVGSVVVVGGYADEVSLTLSGANAGKFELSGGLLSLSVNVIEEQTLTVTVVASRGDETETQEVVVAVYAPLGLSAPLEVVVTTHQRYTLTVVEASGGDASSYSYTLTSPTLAGVSINADNGELVLSLTVAASHTLTVQLSDGAGSEPVSQAILLMIKQRAAAIEALRDIREAVLTVTLIENVDDAAAYTFAVTGGVAPYSYTFAKADGLSVNATSGVLSYSADGAKAGVYTVTVSADDATAVTAPITLLLTVEVSAVLSVEVSDGAKDGVDSFVNLTGVLSAVELSGVGGIAPYTFTLLANDNFAIDADGKNFRITAEFRDAVTVSVVWVLDDSDGRTPAVTGTVQVEIRDELGFADNSPVVNVTVGVKSDGVIYTAKAQKDDNATYSQIGTHSSFTVSVSDSSAGALVSMISALSVAMTATLTIKAMDAQAATLILEVRAYDELSASLAAGFVDQIYVGESGNLGTVDVSGGSGAYVYEWILPMVGFTRTGGVLEADGQATVGVYTVTVVASDNTLGGWIAATVEATVSVGAALSLLEIEERQALVQGEVGEELVQMQVSGGDGSYTISDNLPSGLTISLLSEGTWAVKRAGNLSLGANVGTVIIDDSYALTEPGTPALTAVLTIVGIANFESPWDIQDMEIIAGGNVKLSAEGGTENKTYGLSTVPSGFSLSEAGVLSVAVDVDADSYTLTVVVADDTAGVVQAATATLLVEVLERLQLLSVPSLTVTTSETREVVYSFAAEGEVGNKTYSLENVGDGFGFEFEGAALVLRDDAEAGLYTLSVLAQDGTQESRVSVTVLVIEDVVLSVGALMSPVWSTFNGAVATLTASGGNGDELEFVLVGDSQVFTLAAGSSTLSLNAGLRGHQGAATLSATVSVSDGNDSAAEVIEVLVSGALQVVLEDLISPVPAQYDGSVGNVVVLGGYAGTVSLTLSGADKDKFELSSGGSLSLQVNASEEQMLTVTVVASRGGETETKEVVVMVYAPLGLSVMSAVTVTTHKGDMLAIIEGSGGDASSYSYTLTSPTLAGVSINADNGELLLSLTVAALHTLTVQLSDGAGSETVSREISVLVIEPLRDISEVVLAVTLIENVDDAAAYTFTLSGGIAPYSYTFAEAQSLSVSVNADSGVLSYSAGDAKPGVYTVTVSADDATAVTAPITLLLTVEVSAVLTVELSDGAKDGVGSFVNFKGPVAGVELSGVGGIAPYTFTLLANDNFAIDADGKNFRITMAFAEAMTVSVAWVLDDSDERTPAVTGTVRVEIEDALGFADNKPVVNVTVGVEADGVLYTAKAQQDDGATYQPIGSHSSFTVNVSNAVVGAVVSMTMELSEESTVTLTIVASKGEERATLALEVRAYDELSASLAAGFVGQIYVGESGALGTVDVSGGSGAYVYEWTLPTVGFTDTDGVLEADGQATVGVYTVTVMVSDNTLGGWIAATVEATVSVGAALSLLEIQERSALAQGEVGEELVQVQVSGGDGAYKLIGQDLSSGLTIALLSEGTWAVNRASNLSVGVNVGTVIIDDSYSTTDPGTPALTAVLTIEGIANFVPWVIQDMTITTGGSVKLSAEGGTEAKTYGLSPELGGFALSPAGVLSVSVGADGGSYTLTVVVSDLTAGAEQSATAALLVEVLERLQLLSVPSLTVTTSEARGAVYSFAVDGGVGEKTYSLENVGAGFGFEFDGATLILRDDAEAGLYTLSVLAQDGTQESRVSVTVLVIEDVVLAVGALMSPVWSTFNGAVATLTASGGNGDKLMFALMGDSEVFRLADGSSTLSLNAGLRGHQGAATLSATVSVSDGNDSAMEVIEVLVSGALQVVLADGLTAPVDSQYEGLVGSVVVLGGYAGEVSLTLKGPDAGKFELSGGSLSLSVNVSKEQTLTVTVVASRGDETAAQEVVVSVYAPLIVVASLAVAQPPQLEATEGVAKEVYVFQASGGIMPHTYTLLQNPDDNAFYFTQGTLSVNVSATIGEYRFTVAVADAENMTVTVAATVTVKAAALVVETPPRLEVTIGVAKQVYVFKTSGGIMPHTYTLLHNPDDNAFYFTNGTLSVNISATIGEYHFTVAVADAANMTVTVAATVSVKAAALAVAQPPRLEVTTGVAGEVYVFEASGGIMPHTYTLVHNPDDAAFYFAHGTLSVNVSATSGEYRFTVKVTDAESRAVTVTATVEVAAVALVVAQPPRLEVTTGVAGEVYVFEASGGIMPHTYTLLHNPDDAAFYFAHGTLSVNVSAAIGEYRFTVAVADAESRAVTVAATVEMVALPLAFLAEAPPLTVPAGVSVNLYTFAAIGGIGDKRYTIVAGNEGGFGLAADSGVLSLLPEATEGVYTLAVEASDRASPPSRITAAATVRVGGKQIFVLGGWSGERTNDVWSSANGKGWEKVANAGWSGRNHNQAVPHHGRLYMLGGWDGNNHLNDVWSSTDGRIWVEETAHADWSGRNRHQAVSHHGRLYVLGGWGGELLNDVWSSADGKVWVEETAHADWSGRYEHQAVSFNGRLYVLGGWDGGNRLNDVWSSADGKVWVEETAHADWSGRNNHKVVSHHGRLYVLGGSDGNNLLNDVWSAADGKIWVEETANADWPGREDHQAVSFNGRLYVLGGWDGNNVLNDVWSSAGGKNWSLETNGANWSRRNNHYAVIFPPELALVGVGGMLTITAGTTADHTFTAQYGVGDYTYSLNPAVSGFDVSPGGVLAAESNIPRGEHTLTVWVEDSRGNRAQTAVRAIVPSPLANVSVTNAPPLLAFAGTDADLHIFGHVSHGLRYALRTAINRDILRCTPTAGGCLRYRKRCPEYTCSRWG